MRILVLHGPNLNLLGVRETTIYGDDTLESINEGLIGFAQDAGIEIELRQSNREGELVDWIQEARGNFDGLVINPAAYTHTSVAIRDALLALSMPLVEVHLSNTHSREDFRKESLMSDIAMGCVMGFGAHSYLLGLQGLIHAIKCAKPAGE